MNKPETETRSRAVRGRYGTTMREENGMALASVLAFGVVITLFVGALLETMMPILQKTAQFKGAGTARSYADLGLDYAIQQMNDGNLDCASTAGATLNWSVPSSVLMDGNSSVDVNVATLSPSATAGTGNPPSSSILFDPLLNAQNQFAYRQVTVSSRYGGAVKQLRCLLEPLQTVNRIPYLPYGVFGVESVTFAGQAGFSSYNGSDPRVGADCGTLGKITMIYGGTPTSSANANRAIVQGGSQYIYSNSQSSYAQQFGNPSYTASTTKNAPWMVMTGNVYSNGSNSACFPVTGPADTQTPSNNAFWMLSSSQSAHNVIGFTNGVDSGISNGYANQFVSQTGSWSGGLTALNVGPLNADGVTYPQPTITTTPTAPAGSINLGNINLTNATLWIDNSAPAPTGPIGSIARGSVRIPPGNYIINSLSLANGSSIQFTPATQSAITNGSSPPAAFYVAGTNNATLVATVDNTSSVNMNFGISNPLLTTGFNTSGNIGITSAATGKSILATNQLAINPPGSGNVTETSGSAGQLQLYYSGSGFNSSSSTYNTQILLSGNQRMLVYAPNTGILIGSPSTTSNGPSVLARSCNFYGAVVGGSVGLNSGYVGGSGVYMHYDMKLRPPGTGYINPFKPGLTLDGAAFKGYRAVTWQEAIQPDLINPSKAKWTYQ